MTVSVWLGWIVVEGFLMYRAAEFSLKFMTAAMCLVLLVIFNTIVLLCQIDDRLGLAQADAANTTPKV